MDTTLQVTSKPTFSGAKRPILRLPYPPIAPITPTLGRMVSIVPPQPASLIPHPTTGQTVFGFVPPLPLLTGVDDSLPVVLPQGRQSKNGKGLGAAHSWGGHRSDHEALGAQSAEDTALLGARVILEGTTLYFEETNASNIKLVAHRPGVGTVVIGFSKWGYRGQWKVITAHGGKGYLGNPIGRVAATYAVAPLC